MDLRRPRPAQEFIHVLLTFKLLANPSPWMSSQTATEGLFCSAASIA
ncbi:hypothetical protein XCR_2308 [Xanthomonas campestris pv. raphani 756C]|nr:hypothetical protein XCR_2308 [Xanthomonas campestris pv. raphani 756C]